MERLASSRAGASTAARKSQNLGMSTNRSAHRIIRKDDLAQGKLA
jgi:hypothetical protein